MENIGAIDGTNSSFVNTGSLNYGTDQNKHTVTRKINKHKINNKLCRPITFHGRYVM